MSAELTNRVTAQDFYDYDKCPHRVYLNRFGDENKKLPRSDFLNLLFERALTHELDVIAGLKFETPIGFTLQERTDSTLQLMHDGAERIYQGVLLQEGESGIPDLLERVNGSSKFGDYSYKPVDVKAGSGYLNVEKGLLREDYGMQLYHYGLLLQAIQGVFPPNAEILNRRGERILYRLADFKDAYESVLVDVRALVTGARSDEPAYFAECGKCQWWGHCERVLVDTQDVTLLPDVGRSKKLKLNEIGVRSIQQIRELDFSKVALKGIGQKTIDSMKRAAISVLSNKMQVLAKALLPDAPRKVYLDFEDDPTQELIYLCGVWIEPALQGLNYHGLFCANESGESKIWSEFQNLCATIAQEDYVVFHYSPYEKAKLTSLERKYGTSRKDDLELFRSRMVDLLPIVERSVVLPSRGYGLKAIAPFVGIEYSAENAGGAQSIVWFQDYQRDPSNGEVLKTLLTYNKEDCLAMKSVEEWLRKL
jgi:predicted RecB family nuclease